MRSSKRCVGAARTVLLAVALATVNTTAAGASQFGMEGTDAVVRFDPGEQIQLYNSLNGPSPPFRIETNAATGTVTATNDVEPFFGGAVPPSTNPWGLAAPRAGAGCAPGTGRTVVCPLAGVQRIRVEFGTAAGVGGPVVGQVRVLAAALPVVVQGGPNGNFAAVATTGPVTIDGGDGDDQLTVNGASGGAIAGGAGNDQIFTRSERAAASALRVSGGPGNDLLSTADHTVNGSFDPAPVSRHIIECGAGADRVTVDDRDVLGAGCAPAVTGLKTGGTLGRFDPAGVIAVPPLRLKSPSALRIEFGGPRPPSFTIPTTPSGSTPTTVFGTRLLPRVRGTIRTTVRARPSVRAALRTRRAPVTRSNVTVRARRGGDETTLFVRGTLRPGRTAR